ncbi:MAG: DUF4270 family protein [Bacteroidota bacterium]
MHNPFKASLAGYICLLGLLTLFSCEKDSDIGLELHNQDEQFKTYFTDTVTVLTSTVLIDSINTTNAPYLIAGRYVDSRLGKISAKSFFEVGMDHAIDLGTKPVFDSLVLLLKYAYSYGDTNQVQQLSVHRLDNKLNPNKKYYSKESVSYESTPLGSVAQPFKARPRRGKKLSIRLPDELGKEIVAKTLNKDFSHSNPNLDFINYFKGLALVPGENDNASVIAFVADTSAIVRLYYHVNEAGLEKKTYDFKVSAGKTHFHQIISDRSATLLTGLKNAYDAVEAKSTGNETFIQEGIGLYTRIDIPYLNTFNDAGRIIVNSARLVIRPVSGTYRRGTPPPRSLIMYLVNARNRLAPDKTFPEVPQEGVPYLADEINGLHYYSFPFTYYINTEVQNNVRSQYGLLLASTNMQFNPVLKQQIYESAQVSVERLIMGGNHHSEASIKLELTYTLVK